MKTTAEKIQKKMQREGRSVRSVARDTGLSINTVRAVLANDPKVRKSTLSHICLFFGIKQKGGQ